MKFTRKGVYIGACAAVAAIVATFILLGSAHDAGNDAIKSSTRINEERPIKIGVAVGLTGANGVVAPTVVQSSVLAVEEINAAGGILGRKVALEVVDDGSGAVGAEKALEALLFEKKVDAVIAMETSAARTAALPVVARANVPYIYTSFYEGRSCNPWMHVNGWVPEQQVAPVVDFLGKQRNARTYFLVGSDYSFGRGMLEYAKQYIRSSGAQVVGEEYLPVEGSDWTAVVAKIKSTKPDALISATAGGAPNVSFAKHLRAAGITIPYGNLAIDENTAREMGEAATGMLMSASYLSGIESPENNSFRMRMLVRFGSELKAPNELSVPQYEAFHLYKAAAEIAQSIEPKEIIKALGMASYVGPRGKIQMGKSRHTPLPMRLAQVRSDGTLRILETFQSVEPGAQCPGIE